MADNATGPEGPGDKTGSVGKPDSADRATDAGQAEPRDKASQPGNATSADEGQQGFREALERKRAREAGAADVPRGKTAGKIHGTRGPAANRRSFRRKSG
jgi:Family of unknown function (DUF5302)